MLEIGASAADRDLVRLVSTWHRNMANKPWTTCDKPKKKKKTKTLFTQCSSSGGEAHTNIQTHTHTTTKSENFANEWWNFSHKA